MVDKIQMDYRNQEEPSHQKNKQMKLLKELAKLQEEEDNQVVKQRKFYLDSERVSELDKLIQYDKLL